MTTYGNERNCLNCIQHDHCWENIDVISLEDMATPSDFILRLDTWTHERFIEHMKSTYGQICGHYEPNGIEISNNGLGPIRFTSATDEDLNILDRGLERMHGAMEDREWDTEENR